ncbi:unconventional myosin-X-like isoform X2 [Corticium candelabrum]|uniref:unconventional myosin-X-like isoform X2 n=1 Tax=Corticium candelabrum TaxID=121492 RepID=UPI002E3745A4|nr:unconventional myosin-X-like isoform X2 [Corticium candelabrum]
MAFSGSTSTPRSRPPPPVSNAGEDPIATSAMLALERLTRDNAALQSEIKHLRDEMAAERQDHARLTENYRATHEDDVQKLLNERKLAASLAEENAALKTDVSRYRGELLRRREAKNGPAFGGANAVQVLDDDLLAEIERELAILRSHIVRLHGKRSPATNVARNRKGDSISDRKQSVLVQLRRINVDMEESVRAVSRGTFSKGKKPAVTPSAQTATPIVVDDLAHLGPPLTEYSILKTLHERFDRGQTYTRLGPHLVSTNPYVEDGADCSTLRTHSSYSPELEAVAREVLDGVIECGESQSMVLTGESGSGKTHAAQLLVRSIFQLCGGNKNADTFKVLAASLSMMQSLGCAWTEGNSNASRVGQYVELIIEGNVVQPACYWYYVDQGRVCQKSSKERNFHIFYQMLAGLTQEERAQYHLIGYSKKNLNYLKVDQPESEEDKSVKQDQFIHFKNCMAALRIPFADVMRILAAVMLLGNVEFKEAAEGQPVALRTEEEIRSVGSLLGVASDRLKQGLTLKTKNVRGQMVQSLCSVDEALTARDCLAKSMYSRTVSAVMRRANSCLRRSPTGQGSAMGKTSRVLSPERTRLFSPGPVGSSPIQFTSPMILRTTSSPAGPAYQNRSGGQRSQSVDASLSSASSLFIGILDMFGFENSEVGRLAHLCINLCSETLHSQFASSLFTDVFDSIRSEGVELSLEMPLESNKPIIDLIVDQDGILDQLDRESLFVKGTTESFMEKLRARHGRNPKYVGSSDASQPLFGIRHFNRSVAYDASEFLSDNRDSLSDDILSVFHRQNCNFRFANHLFQLDLKSLPQQGVTPQGQQRRILSSSGSNSKDDARRTLSQDFNMQLVILLRAIGNSNIRYIQCVKSNISEEANFFDRAVVTHQLRSLLVLQTAQILVSGFAHRLHFREFARRYRCLLSSGRSLTSHYDYFPTETGRSWSNMST